MQGMQIEVLRKEMPRQGHVVIAGKDGLLLRTRLEILSRRYAVTPAGPGTVIAALLAGPCDLLVLCSSLEREQTRQILDAIRRQKISVRVLALETGTDHVDGADEYALTTTPEEWVDAVDTLLCDL